MKNIVVSLKSATHRREHITQEFGKQNIDFEFFDAITVDLVKETGVRLKVDLSNNQYLVGREKACFLSHVCLFQKMLDENIDYLGIFEDDIYLGENAHLFLSEERDWVKNRHLIKLEILHKIEINRHTAVRTLDNRRLYKLTKPHDGTAGYIISKEMAQLILTYIRNQPSESLPPIDVILFKDYMLRKTSPTTYQLLPAIVVQHDFCGEFFTPNHANNLLVSYIQPDRETRVEVTQPTPPIKIQKEKLSIAKKIKRELIRPFLQLYNVIAGDNKEKEEIEWFR